MENIKKAYHDYLIEEDEPTILILKGHVLIEILLVELIKTQFKKPEKFDFFRLSFPNKVRMLVAFDILEDDLLEPYLIFNKLRNQSAHDLNYKASFLDAFNLCKLLSKKGISFSDETIFNDKVLSEEMYGTMGVLMECIGNLAIDLIIKLHDRNIEIKL